MSRFQPPDSAAKSRENINHAVWKTFVDLISCPAVVMDEDLQWIHHNCAFTELLGWTLEDLKGRSILKCMDEQVEKWSFRLQRVTGDEALRGVQSKWLTKVGNHLSLTLDAVLLCDRNNVPAGVVITLQRRDGDSRLDRSGQILLRVSKALHRYRKQGRLLSYVTRSIRMLLQVGGASVIFLDEIKEEFFFQMASYDDVEAGRKLTAVRFPAAKGVAGEIYRTARPLIVADYAKSPYALKNLDEQIQYKTRNMLGVPLRIKDRLIGVLCAVNKRDGAFNDEDVELMSAIADVVAHPIENARVNEALRASFERVKKLNEAKERVIAHLSHELKTPLAVLSASLRLFERKLAGAGDPAWKDAYARAERGLQRLLDMEYAVEDILRQQDQATFDMMTQWPQAGPLEEEIGPTKTFFQQVNIEFLIHELKDPLSIIETNTNMLETLTRRPDVSADRKRRTLGRIHRGTRKMRSLLEALLEVGRAEAVSFNVNPFAPVPVVRQVLMGVLESHAFDLYENLPPNQDVYEQLKFLASKGIRLETRTGVEKLQLRQDETKFRQIVANLLKNALTYRRHLVMIHLTLHKDTLCVSVRDDGPGVADDHKEMIFSRYTQVSSFPGVARSGHGLGLAVSRILARSMDGDITLDSQLGQGAVFRLTLPLEFDRG